MNAKRGIPFFSISLAVADGDTMDDVFFGYVYDFGAGEEWTATRGGGAFLNGAPLRERPKDVLEILSFEATTTEFVADNAARFVGIAERLRVMGSLAITLCHLAAGRVDGVVSLKPRALGRHRRRAAARPRAGPRDRAARRPAVRHGPARPRGPLARRRRRDAASSAGAIAEALDRLASLAPTWRRTSRSSRRSSRVIDPELRRPVTELDMVRGIEIDGGDVRADDRAHRRRLPAALELRGAGRASTSAACPGVSSVLARRST